jgi:hypothetical protein
MLHKSVICSDKLWYQGMSEAKVEKIKVARTRTYLTTLTE